MKNLSNTSLEDKNIFILWDDEMNKCVFTMFAQSANIDDNESNINYFSKYHVVDILNRESYKDEQNLKHLIYCQYGNIPYLSNRKIY